MTIALIDGVKYARWLTPGRVVMAGFGMALAQLTILVMIALWQHGVIAPEPAKTSSDFVSFYAAGKLALAGTPALAYHQDAHFAMEQQFTVPGAQYQFFFYPPVFQLLCAPLALLPYRLAFHGFEAATLVLFLWVMRAVMGDRDWRSLIPLLAFPAVFWTFGLGQNAFLTAALFGGFTLLVDRRPWLAGIVLGLVCYKPHFGLLAPVALLARGNWRAIAAAGATVCGLVGLSVLLFGVETWQAYIAALGGADDIYSSGRIDHAGMETPFGAARLVGASPDLARAMQVGASVAMACLVFLVWRIERRQPIRAAVLLGATLFAVPLALLYDKLLLLVAIGWLVRVVRDRGFLPWEKITLAATWPLSCISWVVGSAWHIPLGPIVTLLVLTQILRHLTVSDGRVGRIHPGRANADRGIPDRANPAAVPVQMS